MGLFTRKNNGINWQKEVFDISKALPSMVQQLGSIDNSFNDHVEAGREQRKEDKIWQKKLLENSLECSRGKQVNDIQEDIDTLKSDKKGLAMIWKFAIGVGIFLTIIGSILGIIWKGGIVFGEEQEPPYLEEKCVIPIQERVGEYIKTWNDFSKTIKSTGRFDYRKDDDIYVLQVVGIDFCTCELCLPAHEEMFLALSEEWYAVCNSRRLEVIKSGIIRVYVDSKGIFLFVGKVLL